MSQSSLEQLEDFDCGWPSAADRAFIEVQPYHGAWVANRANERLYRMIKGFHEAGNLLVEESNEAPRKAQNLIYPAVFAYRQSIELRLKSLLIEFGPLAGEPPEFRTHDLKRLWAACRRIIEHFEPHPQAKDNEALSAVDAQIAEFDSVDPGSDAFRFAHDTKGKLIGLGLHEVDLINLRRVVASLHNFLECVSSHLSYIEDIASQ